MDTTPFFRAEALHHAKHKQWGGVSINSPVQLKLVIIGAALFVLSGFLFVACSEFSEHCVVKGFFNVVPHLARVYAMQTGVVDRCYVSDGEAVRRGARLYRLTRSLVGPRAIHEQREWQLLQQRQRALRAEVAKKRGELNTLNALLKQHYITGPEVQAKQDALTLALQQLSQLNVELIHYQNAHTEVVRAPIDGVVSNVFAHPGQRVQPSFLLLSIMPEHAQWVAELLVPAAFMRFVARGKTVLLRVDAYPYSQYGTVNAVIEQFSHTILTDAEEETPIHLGKPYYKVWANLTESQSVPQGMTFDAIIPGTRKALWRWMVGLRYA